MKNLVRTLIGGALLGLVAPAADAAPAAQSLYGFHVKRLDGKQTSLAAYQGRVMLIVNTASKCGLTPQYEGLQKLHEQYHVKGLSVLGFPANDFLWQEPGSNAEIGEFCQRNYGVDFDMFEKVAVKGKGQAPLYRYLTSKETNPAFAGEIRWNFDKFLVNRQGLVVARFEPKTPPTDPKVRKAIEAALAE